MKKSFIFIFTFILCFISVVSPCFASTVPSYDSVLDDFEGKVIDHVTYSYTNQFGTTYYLAVLEDIQGLTTNGTATYKFARNNNSGDTYDIKIELLSNDTSAGRQFNYSIYSYAKDSTDWNRMTYGEAKYELYLNFSTGYDLLESTRDIYYKDGSIFFQVPPAGTLAEAIMEVVKAEIPATQNNLMKTMSTVVLCGVGCLALLISLVLLVKVLRRYLPR